MSGGCQQYHQSGGSSGGGEEDVASVESFDYVTAHIRTVTSLGLPWGFLLGAGDVSHCMLIQ